MSSESKVTLLGAVRSGKKAMVGSIGVTFAAVGSIGLTVGAGETLSKLVQLVCTREKLGGSVDLTINEAADVIRESEIFLGCDLPDNFSSDRGKVFRSFVAALIGSLEGLMNVATVDLDEEAEKNAQMARAIKSQGQGAPMSGPGPRRFN